MTDTINIADNIISLLTCIQIISTVYPPPETIIVSKSHSATTNNYCINQYASVIIDVHHTMEVSILQLPNNETISATQTGYLPLPSSICSAASKTHMFYYLHSSS